MTFREILDWCNERAGVSMTDNEIVKALECIATNDLYNGDMQTASICLHAKETMERQKAEIERLKETPKCVYAYDGEVMEYCVEAPCHNYKTAEEIKAEAIREFAEELASRIIHNNEIINRDSWFITGEINNLVKEMVGERE